MSYFNRRRQAARRVSHHGLPPAREKIRRFVETPNGQLKDKERLTRDQLRRRD